MPTEQQIRQWIREETQSHRHDGNLAQEINYTDIFDIPVRYLQAEAILAATDHTVADNHFRFHIPAGLDGLHLVEVHALVAVAGTTATLTVQIANVTDSVDMLSTLLSVDTGEVGSDTATAAVINQANDQIQENDIIRVDVDTIQTGTAGKGLYITLGFI